MKMTFNFGKPTFSIRPLPECQATVALTRPRAPGIGRAEMPTPFARLDHVVIAVRDLDAATAAYAAMLGRAPSWRGHHPAYGTANTLFGLERCYLELLTLAEPTPTHPVGAALASYLAGRSEGIFALALGSDDLEATAAALVAAGLAPSPIMPGSAVADDGTTRSWRTFVLDRAATRGVTVFAIQHDLGGAPCRASTADAQRRDAAAVPPSPAVGDPAATVRAIDHVVLFSDDLAGALALWRGAFGIAERWRREFPERGTVNVGLRIGGVTLELVAPLAGDPGTRGERVWGLAYDVGDVDAAVARLRAAGLAASDARTGLAPDTRVGTLKWTDRLPTLLIQHRRATTP
jgi:catechol 2,3-dioxygenase-like lactoylglutathione lyase family enzyme